MDGIAVTINNRGLDALSESGKFPIHAIHVPYDKVLKHLVKDSKNRPPSKTINITRNKDGSRFIRSSIKLPLMMIILVPEEVNFEETFYEVYEVLDVSDIIDFWNENGYHPDSGFYQVDNSQWLNESKSRYDPQNNLGLKHYLIFGNDSYVEIMASNYSVK